jgi:hypothetical protein
MQNPKELLAQAQKSFDSGNYRKAKVLFHEVLQSNPNEHLKTEAEKGLKNLNLDKSYIYALIFSISLLSFLYVFFGIIKN